ncbi:alpha/beta fold hydrolase [Brevibacterium litoralis]|uniref:alpha/beta fold hydrolase n=1 Tax=Brevibacterium litoralis TaxID=3138935 RepID=UPI0032EC420A
MNPRTPTRADLAVHLPDGTPVPTATWRYPVQAAVEASRPLLLVHGFRGDHHGMDLIARDVRDREVWVPDLPGFGATPPPGGREMDLETYVEWLDGVVARIESVTGRRPFVAGHSFGSILVAHRAARLQEDGLGDPIALLNPITAPALEGPSKVWTRAAVAYYRVSARLPERLGDAVLRHPLIVRVMSEVMATTGDRMLRRYIHDQHARYFSTYADRESLAQAFRTSVSHTTTEMAARLHRPVLVVNGARDTIATPEATAAFVAALPAGTEVTHQVLDGVGHLLHYERPLQTATVLDEFFRRFDRPR